jgi:multidrug resistance efflux pump
MIDPATIAAALASAEANVSALEALARKHAGKPTELDALVLVTAAHCITANLRKLHEATERRTA